MKICYLILAHNNPHHFERLINVISTPNTKIFVHIDAKSALVEFGKRITQANVVFIKERVSVSWGGFSMVQATLNLLSEAFATKNEYDYYCLLSGSDYPLKSPKYIEKYLKEHYGREFINIVKIPNKLVSKSLSRITSYHIDVEHHRNNIVPKIIAHNVVYMVNKLNIQRRFEPIFKGMKPYAGSQWWVLTHSAVQYIMEFVAANPKFVHFFKNTKIPDESFFQTIIGNSQFLDKVARNLTFTDWSRDTPPYPAIIDIEHIQDFKKNGDLFTDDAYGKGQLLFARKFPDSSDALIEFIQKNVW